MRRLLSLAVALALVPAWGATAEPTVAAVDSSDNVEHIYEYQYDGVNPSDPYFTSGTDLAFDGDYIYAPQQGSQGKIHIFKRLSEEEAAEAGQPYRLEGVIPCAGGQNDVAVVEPGLLAVAYHSARCGVEGGTGTGVSLFDVSNPADPQRLGAAHNLPGGTHTLTVHPTEPIIYASPGGLPTNGGGPTGDPASGRYTNAGTEQILDVSDPSDITVHPFWSGPNGCHDFDVTLRDDGDFGICVGLTETTLWDLSDPLAPEVVSRIVPPAFFGHSAIPTPDGQYVIIGDENFGAMECEGGPTGAMWAYDISDPATPIPVSYFAVGRNAGDNPIYTGQRDRWCTAHIFNFIGDSYTMVASWYTGGMNVIDWSDIRNPREIAYYAMGDGAADSTVNYWSAYWHDGHVYANDRGRGVFDAFELSGIGEDGDASHVASTAREGWDAGLIADIPADVLAAFSQRRAGAPQLACSLDVSRTQAGLTTRLGTGL